ncbi:hypothetical protein NC653_035575 [Populus alba x Populus x berolinensis]|uniref:Uncharacterized protein n=1 Tax=Populus alba x Populus x berolinensis TaxID=444605 RepID=A0AAD6LQA1_9ROSI|nr:hypothetical protein NC653_035575 [Populus alba x Populus x berolinensis]
MNTWRALSRFELFHFCWGLVVFIYGHGDLILKWANLGLVLQLLILPNWVSKSNMALNGAWAIHVFSP